MNDTIKCLAMLEYQSFYVFATKAKFSVDDEIIVIKCYPIKNKLNNTLIVRSPLLLV